MVEEQRWRRLDELFSIALDLPKEERDAYLEQVCGNDLELLTETRELLACQESVADERFLEDQPQLSDEYLQEVDPTEPGAGHLKLPSPFDGIGSDDGDSKVRGWGPFELIEVLGEGGAGRVFRARDTRLDRQVAIKVLHRISPHLARRMTREARAQARIDHENVCAVYEVGELEGIPYIALQLIDGDTLQQASASMTLEQKVVVMRQVAAATHAAHQLGVVHRDIKPGNIMLEETEGGVLKPYVLDFGLAQEIDVATLTLTGDILGTPGFMAPEQIEGGVACTDRRTDVFSLGAALYSIIAGRHPFPGATTAAVLMATTKGDALPLGQAFSGVSADLEAIVMKCLEHRQEHRYHSARAFAEDLGRYLDGETVIARPSGVWRRAITSARRHRRQVGAIAVAATVLLVLGSMWLHGRWSARQQADLALGFGQEIERIESVLWKARSLELHDLGPTNMMVRARLADLEKEVSGMGKVAAGPGHTALGRGYLALGELETARSHLEKAWAEGFRTSESAYALGLTLSRQYRQRLREMAVYSPGQRRVGSEYQEAVRAYRDPARDYLARISPGAFDSPDYVNALLAAAEGEFETTLELAAAAREQQPWLYEALILEGEVLSERAFEEGYRGEYGAALATYDEALEAFENALTIGRSDVRAFSAACETSESALSLRVWRLGEASEDDLGQTVELCSAGLRAASESTSLRNRISHVHLSWAEHLLNRGSDPSDHLDRAHHWASKMLESDGDESAARRLLAEILWQRGKYQILDGEDPTGTFSEAIDHATRAYSADETDFGSCHTLGLLYLEHGLFNLRAGGESIPMLSRAVDLFQKATSMAPTLSEGHINTGVATLVLAYALASGQPDPGGRLDETLASAQENLEAGLDIEPENAGALVHLGNTHLFLAQLAQARGQDPGPRLSQAIEYLSRSIARKNTDAQSHISIAAAYQQRARYQMALGLDPESDINNARAAIERGQALLPDVVKQSGLLVLQAQLEEASRSAAR